MCKYLRGFKFLIMFIGGLFILLAFDSFSGDAPIFEKIIGFLISTLPGLALMIIVYFLWFKEKVLGIILIVLGISMTIFFGVFEEFPERLGTLMITGPVLFGGIFFLIFGKNQKYKKGCRLRCE